MRMPAALSDDLPVEMPGVRRTGGMRCGDCRFYLFRDAKGMPIEQCRRYPPKEASNIEEHTAELIRDVAWSIRKLINDVPTDIESREALFNPLLIEATEVPDIRWPYADEDDWCGEFQSAGSQAEHRVCKACGGSFVAGKERRIVARFCSDKCRVAFNNARRGK